MNRTNACALVVLVVVAAGAGPVGVAAGADQSDCTFPLTHTDATGTEVTVEETPGRVVTLGPSAAQTMWEIGGKEQVVGVTQYASYLDGADSRRNVSGAGRAYVNVEAVVDAEPDLVLAANIVANETVRRLRDSGLTVYRFELAASVEDIYAKTELIGELTDNCGGASETVSRMRDRIGTVREAVENADSPRVFVSQGGGWTAGQGTFVGHVVELAGGTNVAAEANISGYRRISEEDIVERDPEWIVQVGRFGTYPRTDAYNGTHAVQNDQVITVSSENISQPAPRVVHAVVKMARTFHPDAYAATNATTTAETTTAAATEQPRTTTGTGTVTTEGETGDETTEVDAAGSGGVPGFGALAAVMALAGGVLLARRR